MKKYFIRLLLLITILALADAGVFAQQNLKPVKGPLMTKWAADVTPGNVHQEYPRPQFIRKDWRNLNGVWQIELNSSSTIPFGKDLSRKILVPFPIESALSGVMRKSENVIYRRTFKVSAGWKGKNILLHFGAVDWKTTVYVNGEKIGTHKGGYDPFTFDITGALKSSGDQELIVKVYDPTDKGAQPSGKQINKPGGIFYTSTTGIWQTVWLEPVNSKYISSIKIIPNVDNSTVSIEPAGSFIFPGDEIEVFISKDGEQITSKKIKSGGASVIHLKNPELWWPSDPQLYDVDIKLVSGGKVVDKVKSYFGMRKISLGKDKDGVTKFMLNNKFVFQLGPLDQGFWPDGIYAAPTDEALKYDIEIEKKLGFNMVRKHVKVEPQRWYYWCDKLGLLVWQDMPSPYPTGFEKRETKQSDIQFEKELDRMIANLYNHPSIIMWVVFNESWGQHDTKQIVDHVRKLDDTRLIDNASGWDDKQTGDVIDMHAYPGPDSPDPEENRAAALGEFGGLGYPVDNHLWTKEHWGYRDMKNLDQLNDDYKKLFEKLWWLKKYPGLSAAVYTQITDVETEVNGIMTYDRKVLKLDEKTTPLVNSGELPLVPRIEPGINIFIDSITVSLSSDERSEIRYTLNGDEPGRKSTLYTSPLTFHDNAEIKAKSFNKEGLESTTATFRENKVLYQKSVDVKNAKPGLKYSYYEGSWQKLPDFDTLKPVRTGISENINFKSVKPREDFFGIVFSGYLKIPADNIYRIHLRSDDGSRMFLDGKEVIDNDGLHGDEDVFTAQALAKGFHQIKVLYFEGQVDQTLKVLIETNMVKKHLLTGDMLYH